MIDGEENLLRNLASECMTRPLDQRRVKNAAPVFVRQLEMIEIKKDEDVLEAIKRKFQAEENHQKWIEDDLVEPDELDDYEARLKEVHRLTFSREDGFPTTEEEKRSFGRGTLRSCEEKAVTMPISKSIPYMGYGAGTLHVLADHREIGWHPDWKDRLEAEDVV